MKKFEVLLKENGYKMTGQRQIIWNILLESQDGYLSPKEIWEIARQKDKALGISTVYRSLQIMDELGIIRCLDKKDEISKYELASGEDTIHPHLICMYCGKIIGVAENLFVSDSNAIIHDKYNFEVRDIQVKYYGICSECTRKSCEKQVV